MVLRRKGIILFTIGLVLISVSFYPLFLMIRETVLESYINSRYEVKKVFDYNVDDPRQPMRILDHPIELEGNTIQVLTYDTNVVAPKTRFDKEPKHIMNIIIKINGKEESFPTEAWLSPSDKEDSRFLSWLNILKIEDNRSRSVKIAIVQRLTGEYISGESYNKYVEAQKWRVLYIDKNKKISREVFSYPERGNHLLGVKLVQLSSQSSSFIGYKSDISYYLPSYYFPLVYPTGTSIVGMILLIIGIFRLRGSSNGRR